MNRMTKIKPQSEPQSEPQSQMLATEIQKQFLGHNTQERSEQSDLRVVLYSHDTMGMGHMRRNMLIASTIKQQFPNASVLTLAGAKEACDFARSAGVDCLTLPSFHKNSDGTYTSRSLGIPSRDVLDLRRQTILAAMKSYQPNLFIADKLPAGAGGELLPSLDWLSNHTSCRCVLGLRDILDSPEKVIADWRSSHSFAIIRKYFQSIWIYGDRKVYDSVSEYEFPSDVAARVRFTGYLDTRSRLQSKPACKSSNEPPFVLCTVGGGQDGEVLPLNFVEAMRASARPSKLLTGPNMPASTRLQIHASAKSVPGLDVIEFVSEGDYLVKNASHVVSMGGYNTLAAILSYQKPALIVPRVSPRQEQAIRANRLAELGYVQTIHPDELSSEAIVDWLDGPSSPPPWSDNSVDMQGLHRVCEAIHADFPKSEFCNSGVEV